MKKLLDVTDKKTRALQAACLMGCGFLGTAGVDFLRSPEASDTLGYFVVGSAVVLLIVTGGIKQRWEIEYRGHRIRFENSPLLGERLFLDEGLVARGGLGKMVEMRAPIRVGDGAGEEIMALVQGGFLSFRLRIFIESEHEHVPAATILEPARPGAGRGFGAVTDDIRPLTQSAVLGRMTVAKEILELVAALIGIIGGLSAAAVWLF